MKTIANTTRYQCEYCRKEYKVGHACQKHEVKCSSNPANRFACSGCEHLEQVTKDIETDEYPYGFQSKAFFCKKKSIGLYPPKVEHNGMLLKFPEAFKDEDRMPLNCDLYEFNPGF